MSQNLYFRLQFLKGRARIVTIASLVTALNCSDQVGTVKISLIGSVHIRTRLNNRCQAIFSGVFSEQSIRTTIASSVLVVGPGYRNILFTGHWNTFLMMKCAILHVVSSLLNLSSLFQFLFQTRGLLGRRSRWLLCGGSQRHGPFSSFVLLGGISDVRDRGADGGDIEAKGIHSLT